LKLSGIAVRHAAFIRPILRPAVRAGFRWYYGFRGWQGRLPAMWAQWRQRLDERLLTLKDGLRRLPTLTRRPEKWPGRWKDIAGALAAKLDWTNRVGRAEASTPDQEARQNRALLDSAERCDVVGIGQRAFGRHIVMLVVSDLRIDPRVEREARALASAGYRVTVICPEPTQGAHPDLTLDWGPGVEIDFCHWSAAGFVTRRPGYLAAALFERAVKHRAFAFHAHDLSTTFAARAAARLTGAHFVADFHEWWSENVHWDAAAGSHREYSGEWKAELQALERCCLRDASVAITVCDSIADAMSTELGDGRKLEVIRNIPNLATQPTRHYEPLKKQLGIADSKFVLLWQGGTGPTRLIEPIIEALAFAPDCTFVIRGPSLDIFGEGYRAVAARAGVGDRLILTPPVPSRDVVSAGRGADLGVWTLPKLCRNFTFALPNKIFEYMAAGLPVIVADYPEARRVIEKCGVGLTFDPYNPRSIASAINHMIANKSYRQAGADNSIRALDSLSGLNEGRKLADIYDRLPRTMWWKRFVAASSWGA
jgi:glycosyltransferase involved in cell wall biosynthesis